MRMPQACLFAAQPNQDPDTILVSIGSSRLSNRFFRAQVTLTRPSGQTVIRIRPGGTSSEFPINALGIARKIRQVLASSPAIRRLPEAAGPRHRTENLERIPRAVSDRDRGVRGRGEAAHEGRL
jgi:hypothetical protein